MVHAKAKPEGRIIVLGDVHGCLDELRVLLDKVQVQPQTDTLVFVVGAFTQSLMSSDVLSRSVISTRSVAFFIAGSPMSRSSWAPAIC